jgi:plasmid stability protein
MATVIVHDLDDGVYKRLEARAAGNNRTLEGELRDILISASKQVSMAEARAAADRMAQLMEGRPQSDSGEILSQERLR